MRRDVLVLLLPEGMQPPVASPIDGAYAINVGMEDAGLLDETILQRGLAAAGQRITARIRTEAGS